MCDKEIEWTYAHRKHKGKSTEKHKGKDTEKTQTKYIQGVVFN